MKSNKIVVAVDLTPMTLETLSQIKGMNFPENAEIHLVHVFEYVPNLMDLTAAFTPTEKDLAEVQLVMLEKLGEVKKQLGLSNRQKVYLRCLVSPNGKQEFLQYADSLAADLVIAASKERQGFIGLFESSFTDFLSRYCRANLLILRPIPQYNVGR